MPLLHQTLDELEAVRVEKITETLPYFSIDEHYKDVNIRFFILQKAHKNPKGVVGK
jgi:hypothetical protein